MFHVIVNGNHEPAEDTSDWALALTRAQALAILTNHRTVVRSDSGFMRAAAYPDGSLSTIAEPDGTTVDLSKTVW